MYGMRGPREDPDDVIENPLKLGIIQANALAVGLLNAARFQAAQTDARGS